MPDRLKTTPAQVKNGMARYGKDSIEADIDWTTISIGIVAFMNV